jgi:hypothetical protein
VVEEISQISCYLWNDIAKAAMMGLQIILLGDFAQLDPILDTFCGACVPDGALQRSGLLHELSGGVRLTLRTNHRSDPELFGFYTSLGAGSDTPRDLQEALGDARAKFPVKKSTVDVSLVISHNMRMTINRQQNLAMKPASAILIKAKRGKHNENSAQNMWIYEGQQLIGAGGRIRKGVFVTIMFIDETDSTITLDNGISLSCEHCSCFLRLSHSITYAACQGLTLYGRVRLCETSHPAFSLKHLYVGSSRCTGAALLEVE